eukprot:2960703-Karenia_brevis.AAC.1
MDVSCKPLATGTLRKHLCFIANLSVLQRHMQKHFEACQTTSSKANAAQSVDFMKQHTTSLSWSSIYSAGEFHVSSGWQGIDCKIMKFEEATQLSGQVCIFVGSYVGPIAYAVDCIKRGKQRPIPQCTKSLLSLHAPET